MQNALARKQNPALRQGLLFGIILGFVLLAISFISTNFLITLILILLAAYVAGVRASVETGKLTTGTVAGLWTGLIGIIIPSIVSVVLVFVNLDSIRQSYQASADRLHQHITYTNSMVFEGLAISLLFLLIIGILPGAIGGLLGGLSGSRRVRVPAAPEYQEAMFEPPVRDSEEPSSISESEESPATSEATESQSASESEEQLSESSTQESTSSTQQSD